MPCSTSSAGRGSDRRRRWRRSRRSAATTMRPSTGRPTSPAASSASRSSMAARRSATPRPAAWSGTSRIRCRCTASRSTRRGAIWSPSTRPSPTASCTACRCCTSRSRRRRSPTTRQDFPIILTSGRLVEYEGGGDETRSNPWLAELQQKMFVEINPPDANNLGIKDGEMVWVEGPEKGKVKVMAMVTERVGKGVAFMPFHFGGISRARTSGPSTRRVRTPTSWARRPTPRRPTATTPSRRCRKPRATLCKISRA